MMKTLNLMVICVNRRGPMTFDPIDCMGLGEGT